MAGPEIAQHYLTHLLLPALLRPGSDTTADSNSRIVVVSSGAIRRVTDPSTLEEDLLAGSGKDGNTVYAETKFVQLLGAHWWRRKLKDTACKVVAVSPGLIPGTGIGRGSGLVLSMEMKDAKSVDEGEFPVLYVSSGVATIWALSAYMWRGAVNGDARRL